MVVFVFSSLVLIFGTLPCASAGNQCANQFPGRGYCIENFQICPAGSQEFPRLSNGLGCSSLTKRCCVTGTIGGDDCVKKFPGRGFCINNYQFCPEGADEYTPLSNNQGCSSQASKCCVTGTTTPGNDNIASDRSQCGMGSIPVAPRIQNGINAGPCDWPFVVSIRSKKRQSSNLDYFGTAHICAGVLIGKSWVLTSAVCILNAGKSVAAVPNEFIVVAGEYNIVDIDTSPIDGGQQEQIIRVERAFIHPNYAYASSDQLNLTNPQGMNSDSIGLIKLAQPIVGRCSGIICLPNQNEAHDQCATYKDCVITGWGFLSQSYSPPKGARDKLKQGRVMLASKKGCDLVVRRLGYQNTRPAGTMCQYPAGIQTDGCLSDEGGAVMCSTGSNWVVRGILPFQMCTKNKVNLFVTDVTPYLTWIQNTIA